MKNTDHIYKRLKVRPFINAADSYTVIGGSRMSPDVLEVMRQAADHFVELNELHDRVGEAIAVLTRNEAAMVTSGAAAGLTISVAACIAGYEPDKKRVFPHLSGLRNEVIVHRCQRNAFDMAMSQLGVEFVEIGGSNGTLAQELQEAISPRTACIVYFDTRSFARGALPLDKVIEIARSCGIPVIVDAAAQLPPIDNLWRYTERGADLVIFSGGKTLAGPQSSGLIVGRSDLIRACRLHAGPDADAVGRPMKVGREEMVGLYAAIEQYFALDHEAVRERHERVVQQFCHELADLGYKTARAYPGPTGQDYAYAMIDMRGATLTAEDVRERMKAEDPAVLIGLAREEPNHFFLNPLHLRDEEIPVILRKFHQMGPIEYKGGQSMPETPCLFVDLNKMRTNIRLMADVAARNGVRLRPHTKTHKIPAIAKEQIQAGASGITVAKISEAEVMAEHGVSDIFLAYPLVTELKIERAIRLSRKIELIVGVDSYEGARRLMEAADRAGHVLNVRLEIDTGLKRTGVPYDRALALACQINNMPNLRMTGIYTFRGAMIDGKATLDLEKAGIEEGRLMVMLADEMRKQGISIEDVSVGSTPTSRYAAQVQGVTEIRPGTYVFQDRMQAKLGVCSLDDCAAVIRTTIISRPTAEYCVVDGGSKTFATDVQPNTEPLGLRGFGHIVEAPDAVLERLSEEHGVIRLAPHHPFKVGDQIHIIPNHVCSTVNLHNNVIFVDGDSTQEVSVLARGMLE